MKLSSLFSLSPGSQSQSQSQPSPLRPQPSPPRPQSQPQSSLSLPLPSLPSQSCGDELGAEFACEIVRQRRKTLALHVTHRRVEVRVPLRVSRREVEAFVGEHHDWIQQRLATEAQRDKLRLRIEQGGRILYKARELRLHFREALSDAVYVEDDLLVIQGRGLRGEKANTRATKILAGHLQAEAQASVVARVHALAGHLQLAGQIKDVRFRKTKTKWGHCTSTGVLQFNWLIMLAPNAVVDYLIAHEVCHLKHLNHSKAFWALVESVCPDSQRYIGWLKENEQRLYF